MAMTRCVALLRGVNVGRANRLAMRDLRELLCNLDCTNVRTMLNSGNAVFDVRRSKVRNIGAAIESAIRQRFGLDVPTVVRTAPQFESIITDNPLTPHDPTRLLVAFTKSAAALRSLAALAVRDWALGAIAIGGDAAYLWCAHGIAASPLMKEVTRRSAASTTTRNWRTMLAIQAAYRQSARRMSD